MDCQGKCENGMRGTKAHMMLMFAEAEETHGDGTGMINGRKSFTLVELLVVIAIIGILSAMLLTSVAKAKQSAEVAQCHNYRRQLIIYYFAEDYDQYYTPSYRNIAQYNVKRELMLEHRIIQDKCYNCHVSVP